MFKLYSRFFATLISCLYLFIPVLVIADGSAIDKIYHPYVQPMEREFELSTIITNSSQTRLDGNKTLRLGYGQSINDRWFVELYLIGTETRANSFDLSQYEVEALWQLTEQGEFDADFGLLFEFEQSDNGDVSEFSTGLLIEKEWNRWTTTANLYGIYEFGSNIEDEFEAALNLQARYRNSMHFEPAIEIYKAEDTFGIGPAFLGSHPLGDGRRIRWEAGWILGIDNDTPDHTLKALLEYEF